MVQSVSDPMAARRQREEMLPLLKRHEIQVLRRAGHSQTDVARLTGVSTREVRRVEGERDVEPSTTPPSGSGAGSVDRRRRSRSASTC